MCVHTFPTGDESSHKFRSSGCSPSLISEIFFIKAHPETHPYLQSYSTSRWCQGGELEWDTKAIISILQIVDDKNYKTLWKALYHKNVAEINLARAIVPAERLTRSGTAIHEWIYTALRSQQFNHCPKELLHLPPAIGSKSHPWQFPLKRQICFEYP